MRLTSETADHPAVWRRAGLLAAFALIALYFALVVALAPGGPFGDDLDIAQRVAEARVAGNPWPALWMQHNEHRLVTTKLLFWGQSALTGSLNFTLLALLGNLFLLPVFAFLAIRGWKLGGALAGSAVLFVAAMTFSYSSADSMLWAMAAISNYLTLALAAAMFWMLEKDDGRWTLAGLCCALLAVISQGNGLLVIVLGFAALLSDRRWLSAGLWLAVLVLAVGLYMAGFTHPTGLTSPLEALGRPVKMLVFALIVSGSALGYPVQSESLRLVFMAASAALGLLLWVITLRGFWRSRFRTGNALLWFNLFLIGCAGMIALGRLDLGLIQALTPRYHVNSCLLLVSSILMLANDATDVRGSTFARRALPILAGLAVVYVGLSTLTLWRMHEFYAANVGRHEGQR